MIERSKKKKHTACDEHTHKQCPDERNRMYDSMISVELTAINTTVSWYSRR